MNNSNPTTFQKSADELVYFTLVLIYYPILLIISSKASDASPIFPNSNFFDWGFTFESASLISLTLNANYLSVNSSSLKDEIYLKNDFML